MKLFAVLVVGPLLAAGCAATSLESEKTIATPVPAPRFSSRRHYPMQTQTLGTSVEGRPIVMHRFGEGRVGTLILAGVHGDESAALELGRRTVALLQSGTFTDLDGSVAIIPVANPDGVARGTRTNARRVDINRNFPSANWAATRKGVYHGGKASMSEPETAILEHAVRTLAPRQIITLHSISRGRECNNYDGPAEEIAKRMAAYNGYPVTASIGYPTPGSFGSWAGIDLNIPVVTLELPRDVKSDAIWEANRAAIVETIRERSRK